MGYNDNPIQGWTSAIELRWLNAMAALMDHVVEIGSWKGRSTHALASGCPGMVIAVEDFRGIPLDSLAIKPEDLKREFEKNLEGFHNVNLMEMESLKASKLISIADMVFIDGSHDYASVKQDIESWYPKTRKLLCGHDYHNGDWPEVTKAVDELLPSIKRVDSIWYVEKVGPEFFIRGE